jgi:hypothetical protein
MGRSAEQPSPRTVHHLRYVADMLPKIFCLTFVGNGTIRLVARSFGNGSGLHVQDICGNTDCCASRASRSPHRQFRIAPEFCCLDKTPRQRPRGAFGGICFHSRDAPLMSYTFRPTIPANGHSVPTRGADGFPITAFCARLAAGWAWSSKRKTSSLVATSH